MELGTGTGAVGLYAAGCGATLVRLTDAFPEVLDLAQRNLDSARAMGLVPSGIQVEVVPYTWGDPLPQGSFDWVVGSDITYSSKLHGILMDTVAVVLEDPSIRVVLAHADRLAFQLEHLAREADARGLTIETLHADPGPSGQAVLLLEVTRRRQKPGLSLPLGLVL